jgi:hypothetical protein
MSQERSLNEIMESITGMLVSIAKNKDKSEIENAVAIMEAGWAKCDDFDFNKELISLWKQSHKAKEEIKN